MTDRERAIAMAYTGTCFLQCEKLKIFYEYAEELLGRPVFSHELPSLADELKERSRPDFIKLCAREE